MFKVFGIPEIDLISGKKTLNFYYYAIGVPQGSVLGPILLLFSRRSRGGRGG